MTAHTTPSPVGVGIIGLSTTGGWAADAHVPALRSLPEFELRAVSASTAESARSAAEVFDVPYAAQNAADLVARDDVDLVVVTVKVPHHFELVMAALAAGKDVYCEWPLGNGLAEATEMADAAEAAQRHAFVGLQARSSPTLRYMRDLIAAGFIGEPLSTSLIGSGGQWGGTTDTRNEYLYDARSGASLVTIPLGHTLDAMAMVLGEFADLTSTQAIMRPTVLNTDTGQTITVDVSDHIVVSGVLDSGPVAMLHFRGGHSRATNLFWEVNGTEGDLVLTGNTGHLQLAQVTLNGVTRGGTALAELRVPSQYHLAPTPYADSRVTNVANAYAQVYRDLSDGTREVPTFHDAVVRHQVLEQLTPQASTPSTTR
ncbi:Gfo/Idh/MocA family oxidoreductase [Mycolicibacterium mucogenicum]|uniref:Gfo/Idh/MocA family protein n=1 Tax=Mycolicibacterium mucogenicum TaxID=56689 RepID=UPI002269DFC3|nr:Gfo/Idh/MocA family oxidoreductase [Mycolicibacterium mucogenicum]MCX8562874.1 Gfo/Idh/MocA family oxidoreductase [Mycolicibacterium mucogenicum]